MMLLEYTGMYSLSKQNYSYLICDLFVSLQFFCVASSLYSCRVIYKDTEFWLLVDSYMLLFVFEDHICFHHIVLLCLLLNGTGTA